MAATLHHYEIIPNINVVTTSPLSTMSAIQPIQTTVQPVRSCGRRKVVFLAVDFCLAQLGSPGQWHVHIAPITGSVFARVAPYVTSHCLQSSGKMWRLIWKDPISRLPTGLGSPLCSFPRHSLWEIGEIGKVHFVYFYSAAHGIGWKKM